MQKAKIHDFERGVDILNKYQFNVIFSEEECWQVLNNYSFASIYFKNNKCFDHYLAKNKEKLFDIFIDGVSIFNYAVFCGNEYAYRKLKAELKESKSIQMLELSKVLGCDDKEKSDLLMNAFDRGNVNIVNDILSSFFIESLINIHNQEGQGKVILENLAKKGDINLLQVFLDKYQVSYYVMYHSICSALEHKQPGFAEYVLNKIEYKIDVNQYAYLFDVIIQSECEKIFKDLFEAYLKVPGLTIEAKEVFYLDLLENVLIKKRDSMFTLLLNKRSCFYELPNFLYDLAFVITYNGDVDLLKKAINLFKKDGRDINEIKNIFYRKTLLSDACYVLNLKIIQYFIDDLEFDPLDENITPILFELGYSEVSSYDQAKKAQEIVEYLLNKGVSVDEKNIEGKTLLQVLLPMPSLIGIKKLLLERGAIFATPSIPSFNEFKVWAFEPVIENNGITFLDEKHFSEVSNVKCLSFATIFLLRAYQAKIKMTPGDRKNLFKYIGQKDYKNWEKGIQIDYKDPDIKELMQCIYGFFVENQYSAKELECLLHDDGLINEKIKKDVLLKFIFKNHKEFFKDNIKEVIKSINELDSGLEGEKESEPIFTIRKRQFVKSASQIGGVIVNEEATFRPDEKNIIGYFPPEGAVIISFGEFKDYRLTKKELVNHLGYLKQTHKPLYNSLMTAITFNEVLQLKNYQLGEISTDLVFKEFYKVDSKTTAISFKTNWGDCSFELNNGQLDSFFELCNKYFPSALPANQLECAAVNVVRGKNIEFLQLV